MWGVYPEAMDWNDEAVHSDFNLGERIWKKAPEALKFGTLRNRAKFGAIRAFSLNTLTQTKIRVHSANIPVHCL